MRIIQEASKLWLMKNVYKQKQKEKGTEKKTLKDKEKNE